MRHFQKEPAIRCQTHESDREGKHCAKWIEEISPNFPMSAGSGALFREHSEKRLKK